MDIVIVNDLEYPVHITVVEHSVLAIEIVVSHGLVPIPIGTVLRRETLDQGEILAIQGLDPRVRPTMTKKRLPDIRVERKWGTAKKDVKFVMVTLLPADGKPQEDT